MSRGGLEEEGDSLMEDEEDEEISWISWFCSLKGNEFFCEVDEDYIQDDFNLYGLSRQTEFYDFALDLILDLESPADDLAEERQEKVEVAAEFLYGLIHARFILTTRGMHLMEEKYRNVEFGRCPRVHCHGQPCLPVGQADQPRSNAVKIFCPRCEDIFFPRSSRQNSVDGAFFGTTFPHLFLLSFPEHRPPRNSTSLSVYEPKIFGFKVFKPRPLPDADRLEKKRRRQQAKQQRVARQSAAGSSGVTGGSPGPE